MATAGVSLDHVPPDVVLVHVSEEPIQTGVAPVIVCVTGAEIVTVFVAVLTHPPMVTEYVMTAFPADIPVTRPEDAPAVAMAGMSLVHVPPVVVLVHVCEAPMHIGVVPVMV